MRVGLISPTFPHPRGGVYVGLERQALELARHLSEADHAIRIFTTFWNGGDAEGRFEGIPIYRAKDLSGAVGRSAAILDLHHITWGWNLWDYRDELSRCDVVHALSPLSSSKRMASMGLPLVTHFHHLEEIQRPIEVLSRPFHSLIERFAYRNSTLVVTPSKSSADDLKRNFRVSSQRIRVLPHAVNPAQYADGPHAVTTDRIRLLFVGEHEVRKGINYLLDALPLLLRWGLDVELVTIGHGSALRRLRDLAVRLGIADRVEFKGYVPDPDGKRVPRAYAEADMFVLPSLREGFGFVLLEAMASGLPIVATDVSAIPEVVGDAGILVPPRNPSALASAIRLLIDDPVKRKEMGRRGRDRVAALFTWDKVIPQLTDVYQEAIEAAARSS